MAEYKDYIVRYDILVDIGNANIAFGKLRQNASKMDGPLSKIAGYARDINAAINSIKNTPLVFEPTLNIEAFNKKLGAMEKNATTAANNIRTTIQNALTGVTEEQRKAIASAGKIGQTKEDSKNKKRKDSVPKTNLTPKIIEAWGKVFGNTTSKKLTLTAVDKASDTLATIHGTLKDIAGLGKFTIAPILDTAAFTDAETKLQALAKLSAKITKPLGSQTNTDKNKVGSNDNKGQKLSKKDQTALANARQKLEDLKKQGQVYQDKIDEKEKIPQDKRTRGDKSVITKNKKLLKPISEEIVKQGSIIQNLENKAKGIVVPPPQSKPLTSTTTLTVDVVARVTSIVNAVKEAPVIQSVGEITKATSKVSETPIIKAAGEITKITNKRKSAPAISITGNVTKAIDKLKQPAIVTAIAEITSVTNKVKDTIPIPVKLTTDSIKASIEAMQGSIPPLDIKVNLVLGNVAQQAQAVATQAAASVSDAEKKAKITSRAPSASKVSATASPAVKYTPPVFTAEDDARLNELFAKYNKATKQESKALKAYETAKKNYNESGGSNRAFDNKADKFRELSKATKSASDILAEIRPLWFKQFQSTAMRPLSDEELAKGISLQEEHDKLSALKKLKADEKARLAEVKSSLAALRAPVPAQTEAPSEEEKTTAATTKNKDKKNGAKKSSRKSAGKEKFIEPSVSTTATTPQNAPASVTEAVKNLHEQIRQLIGNIPPISLDLNPSLANEKLAAFIESVKAVSPQTINLTATTPNAGKNNKGETKEDPAIKGTVAAPKPDKKKSSKKEQKQEVKEEQPPIVPTSTNTKGKKPVDEKGLVNEQVLNLIPKLDTSTLAKQIADIKVPSLPVPIKLIWEQGAVGRASQLKKLSEKVPPVTITASDTEARTVFSNLIQYIKDNSKQEIVITSKASKGTKNGQNKNAEENVTGAGAVGIKTEEKPKKQPKPNKKTAKEPVYNIPPLLQKPSASISNLPKTPELPKLSPTVLNAPQAQEQGVPKIPGQKTIKIRLNTTEADGQLAAFIAKIKAASPQAIALTATGMPATSTPAATAPVATVSATTAKTTLSASKITTTAKSAIPPAPSGFIGSGNNRVFFGNEKPSVAPKGYRWERTNQLASRLNGSQFNAYNNAEITRRKAMGNLSTTLKNTQHMIDRANQIKAVRDRFVEKRDASMRNWNRAHSIYQANKSEIALLQKQYQQLEEQKQPFLSLKRPNTIQKAAIDRINQSQAQINARIDRLKAPLAAMEQIKGNVSHLNKRIARANEVLGSKAIDNAYQDRKSARTAYRESRNQTNSYTKGWQLSKDEPKPAKAKASTSFSQKELNQSSHYQRLMAQRHNALLPFNLKQNQMSVVEKHWKFFDKAAKTMAIKPAPNMPAAQMLSYLQNVSAQMQSASVAVPIQLQQRINALESQIAKSQGVSESGARYGGGRGYVPKEKPFFEKARKWAGPFTGPTSFGVRTPMVYDMAKGMGTMFAISGAMSTIGNSFSQAMEYQNTMRTTQSILQNGTNTYTQEGFKRMEEIVREVGVKTKFSAPEVANAAKFLAMAGFDIGSINAAIRPIADLALVGDMDLGEVADKMTNIMTTFGVTADVLKQNPDKLREMGNIMTTTATRSNTDLMMLAESAKYGGGVANMYGYNDPNLFADTMAIFGVMGNAGIQGSAAGTALRMMYTNIFKPNKNQQKVLDMLESVYKIKTHNEDGTNRAISDVLLEMGQRIDKKDMSEIVGNLFRITAQSGATSTLFAAGDNKARIAENQNVLAAIAKEEGTSVEEAAAAIDFMTDGKDGKPSGLSTLMSLMLANRNSVNGNILSNTSEAKQNTMAGLWAQVTSMFTEGIVQAFEEREGGLSKMLKDLRDYFASPKTITMLKNLFDLIIELGKGMAWFASIWAKMYSAMPGLIKYWAIFQMAMTQLGSLMSPFVQLTGVFNRFGGALMKFGGAASISASAFSRGMNTTRSAMALSGATSATTAATATSGGGLLTPVIVGKTKKGKDIVLKGKAAAMANKAIAKNKTAFTDTLLAASMISPMGSPHNNRNFGPVRAAGVPMQPVTANNLFSDPRTLIARNKAIASETQIKAHYAEVRRRASKMFGWGKVGGAFTSAWKAAPTMLTFAPIFGGIKSMFLGLMTSLAKAVGFLLNPITLAIAAVGALGWGLYKLKQKADGATEEQKIARERARKAADVSQRTIREELQWYRDLQESVTYAPQKVISSVNTEKIKAIENDRKSFSTRNSILFNDLTKDADDQAVNNTASRLRAIVNESPLYKMALGKKYSHLVEKELTEWSYNGEATPYKSMNALADGSTALLNLIRGNKATKKHAEELQKRMVAPLLITEAAHDKNVQQAVSEIKYLYEQYVNKVKDPKTGKAMTGKEYNDKVQEIRKNVKSSFPMTISANDLTPEQYRNSDDRSVYDLYQEGAMNIIDAYILNDTETINGIIKNSNLLKGKMTLFQDEWYGAVSSVIGKYRLFDEFISDDGQRSANVELMINMLPNHQIDYSSIVHQIQEKIGTFHLNFKRFMDMVATVYRLMQENGEMPADPILYKVELRNQAKNRPISGQDARLYYREHIANNPRNKFYLDNINEDAFVKLATGDETYDFKNSSGSITSGQIRVQMRNNWVEDIISTQSKYTNSKYANIPTTQEDKKDKNTPTNTTAYKPTTLPSTPSQDEYVSNYAPSASSPTQVVFNINNLANFDRLAVASSAEERDLMTAMETRIANAVQQIFAEASNQASRTFMA